MAAPLDEFIRTIYRYGVDVPPAAFRQWALQELRQLIPFDAAIWGSGPASKPHFHTVTTVDVQPDFAQALEATMQDNPLLPAIIERPGVPISMDEICPDRKFYRSALYQTTFKPFGIERILSSNNVEPRSGLHTLLTIYRFDRKQKFRAEEKALQSRAIYHLVHAASQAFFLALTRPIADAGREYGAVCDRAGVFHEVESGFLDLLESKGGKLAGNRLPFPVPVPGFDGCIDHVHIQAEAFDDLVLLRARPLSPLDGLTDRERDVVEQVCEGLSAKAIGRDLGLAPSTVSTHLYRAYRKLGVESRTALAHLVKKLR